MPADHAVQPWAIRSTLIAVSDLPRSIAFYGDIGPFAVLANQDGVAILGGASPSSPGMILRETRSLHQLRHGPLSLGLRSISFNVGTAAELDRIEAVLREHDRFTDRRLVAGGASTLVRGRDPDNLPLVFVAYSSDSVGSDYYRAIIDLVYTMDA
jgi:hypothetical protein